MEPKQEVRERKPEERGYWFERKRERVAKE